MALALSMLAFAPSKISREAAPLEERASNAVAQAEHADALTLEDAPLVVSRMVAKLLRPLRAASFAGPDPQDGSDPRSPTPPTETR
jgi:hypothetical protein